MVKDPDIGYLPNLIPLNEDNPINDAVKYKKQSHVRTPSDISKKTEGLELGAVDKLLVGIFVGCDGEEGRIPYATLRSK